MSDPRLLLAELDATEQLLRSLAIESLDYRGVLGVERLAHEVCGRLLAGLDAGAPQARPAPARQVDHAANVPLVEETTDELLTAGAAPAPIGSSRVPFDEVPDDPTDETPPSSSEVLLRWTDDGRAALLDRADVLPALTEPLVEDEDPTLADGSAIQEAVEAAAALEAQPEHVEDYDEPLVEVHSDELEVAPDSDLAELEPQAEDLYQEEEAQTSQGGPSWVEEESPPAFVEDDTHESRPAPVPAGADPWANLVTFQAPEPEPEAVEEEASAESDVADDPWEEQRRMAREARPAPPRSQPPPVLSPGRDALATMDTRVTRDDLLPDGEPELDELEELELEPDAGLLGDDDEDEEGATHIAAAAPEPARAAPARAEPARAAPAARVAPPRPQGGTPIGGGTAGLYGSSAAVPTIRDSDDPRPRAAAIQLNAGGGGARVLGAEEEDEPIEIGEASADEIDEEGEGGFSIKVQEYEEVEPEELEEEEEEEVEEEEEEAPLEPDQGPVGPSREEVRAMLAAALAAAQNGNLQQGADLYSDLIDQDPDNLEAHVARGRLYLDLGDYSRAMSDFMVAEDFAPTDPEPQVAIGDLYFARKDYRKAIDYFDQALQLAPNHAMAFCRRGISHYYRKNYQEAVVDLEKAKKLDPDIANIQTYISMAKKKVGGK
jgi:tetratricopeptide (TPR) repeat protein